jgi:two-component system response regulator
MSRRTGAILLVDDSPEEVELTLRALHQNDVQNEVAVARDGVEAIEHLFGAADGGGGPRPLPALVLLDLKLPRVDGLEVLTRIRADERTRLLPVVVLTSSHEDRDVTSSYGRGADDYVHKPVDFGAFRDVLRDLTRCWLPAQPAAPQGARHR